MPMAGTVPMKTIVVNGKRCELLPFGGGEPEPGTVIGQRYGRRVYRVLCADGDDYILRNVRNESILMALPRAEVIEEFGIVKEL